MASFACEGDKEMKQVNNMSVEVLDTLNKNIGNEGIKVAVYDVNGPKTRSEFGLVPGAIQLASSSKYDLNKLPTKKSDTVVFYCSSERCSASHTAAERALTAGYTDVNVMKAGIKGWVKAGKKVWKPKVAQK